MDRIDDGGLTALVSTISIAEIRAGLEPAEAKAVWQAILSHLLTSPNYRVEAIDSSIAELAGEIRERNRLSLPDALIIATGKLRGAEFVITQDRQLGRRQSVLGVRTPDGLASGAHT
jgi:predicted nucleic acid-binding protein